MTSSPPDSLFVLPCHMQTLYANKRWIHDTHSLKEVTGRHGSWFKENRSEFRRKRIPLLGVGPFSHHAHSHR